MFTSLIQIKCDMFKKEKKKKRKSVCFTKRKNKISDKTNDFKLLSISAKSFYISHFAHVWSCRWRICRLQLCVNSATSLTAHVKPHHALNHDHSRFVYGRTVWHTFIHFHTLYNQCVYVCRHKSPFPTSVGTSPNTPLRLVPLPNH